MLHNFSQLHNAAGIVGHPDQSPLRISWFNMAASVPANFMSAFRAPNPVVVAQNLPRPVSMVVNTFGNLPPVIQAPLGTNTRI